LDNESTSDSHRLSAEIARHDWDDVHPRIVSFFAHRRCAEADDLAQETMMRVLKWLNCEGNSIEGPDGFVRFVHGCARNVLLEHHRKERERSQRELPMDATEEKLHSTPAIDPDNILAMRQALARLPKQDRICVCRAEFEAAEKVAEDMGILLRTFRVKVFRARKRLQVLLHQPHGQEASGNPPRSNAIDSLESGLTDE
jgi:RNA polymerase sigma factor (sigma-70 family)